MKKIPRHYPLWDDCNTSMEILWERCESYFKSHHPEIKLRFYSDFNKGADQEWNKNETLDVITFGDTIRKMFQTGIYPQTSIRFWSIGSDFRDIQNKLVYQGKDVVNLIPRNELFKVGESESVNFNTPIDLVYAGRLSRQKNVDMLILFNEGLNEEGIHTRLHLFGDFDIRFHEDLGRQQGFSFKEYLLGLIEQCKYQPKLYGHIGKEEWLQTKFNQPVAISLSTFIGEDFGVSLAQSIEKGWPVIASEFGGHKDITSNNLCYIPSWLCNGTFLPLSIKKELVKRIVQKIKDSGFQKVSGPEIENSLITLSHEELDRTRREMVEKIGSSTVWLNSDSLENFADTRQGGLFLRKCKDILETKGEEVLLIYPKDFTELDEEFLIEKLKTIDPQKKLHFINEAETSYPDNLLLLKRSQKAYCCPSVSEKTKEFISQLYS